MKLSYSFGINLVFICVLTLVCCKTKEKSTLSEDEMVKIIFELQQAESTSSRLDGGTDSVRVVYDYLEQGIFKKHKTDSSAFNKSFKLYNEAQTLDEIYEKAIKKAEKVKK